VAGHEECISGRVCRRHALLAVACTCMNMHADCAAQDELTRQSALGPPRLPPCTYCTGAADVWARVRSLLWHRRAGAPGNLPARGQELSRWAAPGKLWKEGGEGAPQQPRNCSVPASPCADVGCLPSPLWLSEAGPPALAH
jgi:hypothetical protein